MSGTYNVAGATIAQGGTGNLTSPITAVGHGGHGDLVGTLNLSGWRAGTEHGTLTELAGDADGHRYAHRLRADDLELAATIVGQRRAPTPRAGWS